MITPFSVTYHSSGLLGNPGGATSDYPVYMKIILACGTQWEGVGHKLVIVESGL